MNIFQTNTIYIEGYVYDIDPDTSFAFKMTLSLLEDTKYLYDNILLGLLNCVRNRKYYSKNEFTETDFEDIKEAILFYFYEHDGIEREYDTNEQYNNWVNFTYINYMTSIASATVLSNLKKKYKKDSIYDYDKTWSKEDKDLAKYHNSILTNLNKKCSYFSKNYEKMLEWKKEK